MWGTPFFYYCAALPDPTSMVAGGRYHDSSHYFSATFPTEAFIPFGESSDAEMYLSSNGGIRAVLKTYSYPMPYWLVEFRCMFYSTKQSD